MVVTELWWHRQQCLSVDVETRFCVCVSWSAALRVVDAVCLSGLPHAGGRVHQPRGGASTHAVPRPSGPDEVRTPYTCTAPVTATTTQSHGGLTWWVGARE